MTKKRTRANNGMGSIRQRADGRWEARYTAPDGRQHSLYAKTEKAVTARLRASLHDLDTGAWREPSKMTVAEWSEIWLNDYCGHCTESTRTIYRRNFSIHINPVVGSVKLTSLSKMHICRVYNSMQDAGKSAKTISLVRGTIKASLNCAIQSNLIKSNPADNVPTKRPQKYEMHIIDRPLIPAFIEAANRTNYGEALILLLLTGMRSGELRGLQWSDVDFEKNIIHIRRQVHTGTGSTFISTPPKEGKTRDIVVPPQAMDILRAQRRKQAEQRLRAGGSYISTPQVKDLVFRAPTGRQLHDRAILDAVHQVADEINLPGLRAHDLRHSYAVAALRSGIDVKTVQHNLGHASAAMTLDTYAAYTSDAGKTGADKLSEYWSKATEN